MRRRVPHSQLNNQACCMLSTRVCRTGKCRGAKVGLGIAMRIASLLLAKCYHVQTRHERAGVQQAVRCWLGVGVISVYCVKTCAVASLFRRLKLLCSCWWLFSQRL